MGFQTKYAAAMIKLFNTGGEDALFNPIDGEPIPCKIYFDPAYMFQPNGVDAQVYEQGITIEALLSVLGREPARLETFTYPAVAGVTYEVQTITENDGFAVTSQVVAR